MTQKPEFNPSILIAQELNIPVTSVHAVILLFDEGNTIPFIARYRKEVTGNLDEVQIRDIKDRNTYLLEFHDRRNTILESIESQGKMTDELRNQLMACESKTALEDLYLPYKPKRRTRAMIAKEKGLEPLAELILSQTSSGNPDIEAANYINEEKGVQSAVDALQGARDIIAEIVSENMDVRSLVRESFAEEGVVVSKAAREFVGKTSKFEDYYDFSEKVTKIPSHRYLAIRRGERESILSFAIEIDAAPCIRRAKEIMKHKASSPFASQLEQAIEDSYKRLIFPSVETDQRVDMKMEADRDAVAIFGQNLRSLLLAAPLGERSVIGIDPGLRTGCKCAAVDSTGKYLDTITIFPTGGDRSRMQAASDLLSFIKRYKSFAIAVGNGTAGRETEAFVREVIRSQKLEGIIAVSVNESGASVYSASDIAREEFPKLDLTIRGAISIARRLQDPLAELVKIDPKAIGVGQYQHDVHQVLLSDALKDVVESSVNHVGVEVNTSSAALLSYVAGVGPAIAKNIVSHREVHGAFASRKALLDVTGLGKRTYEQSAGFLRVSSSAYPLDSSAVHPERYKLVEQMANDVGCKLDELISSPQFIQAIDIQKYVCESVGEHTLRDIIKELNKPGRDPRASFEPPEFRDDVMTLTDVKPGMVLEGIVTNVTAFGAFVDVGVHQDGLVHVSELSDRFIKDPSEVVQSGKKIKVEVLEVDPVKKRISLSARIGQQRKTRERTEEKGRSKGPRREAKSFSSNPFGALNF
jgi:uncharacterized protein